MGRNFFDAIKDLNEGKDTIVSDKEYENEEIKEKRPQTLLSSLAKTNEFGTIGCRAVKNIIDTFINHYKITRKELYSDGIQLSKITNPNIFINKELPFTANYTKFILVPCKSEFESKNRITCFAVDDTKRDLPIIFFIYFNKDYKWSAYVPTFENVFKGTEADVTGNRDATFLNHRTQPNIHAVDNMMFYNYNSVKLKDIGKITVKPKAEMNLGVNLMRYHLGQIKLSGPLGVDFSESKRFYSEESEIYVEFSDQLAYEMRDYTDVIAFLRAIDFNKNPKIQNSELKVSENGEYLYLSL